MTLLNRTGTEMLSRKLLSDSANLKLFNNWDFIENFNGYNKINVMWFEVVSKCVCAQNRPRPLCCRWNIFDWINESCPSAISYNYSIRFFEFAFNYPIYWFFLWWKFSNNYFYIRRHFSESKYNITNCIHDMWFE